MKVRDFYITSRYEVPVGIRALPVHNSHGFIIGAVETFDELEQSDVDAREKVIAGCVDEVTGLASHAQMQFHVREALAAFTDRNVLFGMLRLRVEGLEHFRAGFGPDAAASLLRVMARSLASDLWRTDIIARWSDNKFLVILNGCDGESLPGVRERLRRALANDSIQWWGERRSLPVSIGEATAQPGDTIASILDRTQKSLDLASQWLNRARAAGHNQSPGS